MSIANGTAYFNSDAEENSSSEEGSFTNVPHILLPQHKQLLVESGISPEVARQRGYRSVEKKSELRALGFSAAQCRAPALLVPVYDVTGEVAFHQIRPDSPRANTNGKPIKYETPSKARMTFDCHPSIRHKLTDPSVPLFITEGVRKADAAISQGLCCIALMGVWNFRGTNENGGKTALAAWEYIALNGRDAHIVFDSDVMQKAEVAKALARLRGFLDTRKAHARVIYLESNADGSKVGLDNFLATGHTADDLLARATTELRGAPEPEDEFPYQETPRGIVWLKQTKEGAIPTPLCNFTARIVKDVTEDDGAETRHFFEIEAKHATRQKCIKVPAERFASMAWVTEALGARAILEPGTQIKDRTRAAIQSLSLDIEDTHVFAHLGWRKIEDRWCYLHADGALSADGVEPDISVSVPSALERFALPEPPEGEKLEKAVRASLRLLQIAPASITYPLYAAIWRSVLGPADFAVHLSGPTGQGKSELAALVQQHFGAELDARHLPASWSSTGNSLESLAFAAKDTILVVDDFAPHGSTADVQRLHREADRIFRAQGNSAGRLRMKADTTLRPSKPPRGLILSTGEDIPRGQSIRSRALISEISPGSIDWSVVTDCQEDAKNGLYAQCAAAFICWLAEKYDEVRTQIRGEVNALRDDLTSAGGHKRTPTLVADLAVGLRYFLTFAREVEAIDDAEVYIFLREGWKALKEAAREQEKHQTANDPARRFMELLSAAIASGRAHIVSISGGTPLNAESWGWTFGTARGERIGWLSGEDLYIEPDVSFAVIQSLAHDQGESLSVSARTLRKRLDEHRLLRSKDQTRGTSTVRRAVEGRMLEVLHFHSDSLTVGLPTESTPELSVPEKTETDSGTDSARQPENEPEKTQLSVKNGSEKLTELTVELTVDSEANSDTYNPTVSNVSLNIGRDALFFEAPQEGDFSRGIHSRNSDASIPINKLTELTVTKNGHNTDLEGEVI